MFKEEILKYAENIQGDLVEFRRDFHMFPEPGLEEFRTAGIVAKELKKLGLEVQTGIAVTGVVGLLKGHKPGKTVLLRADMDCLKMDELNDVPYKSQNPGLMHACGHDAHTAWLLGTARILSQMTDKFSGNIKFVFQPAEEGPGGAERMIAEGVMENPHVDVAFGAHISSQVKEGYVNIKDGPMTAAPDFFDLTIQGKGGHSSRPEECIDPLSIGHQVYSNLMTIMNRKISAFDNLVISITKFQAGSANNVIPDSASLGGSIRSVNPELRAQLPEMFEKLIKGVVESHGASYTFEYNHLYPATINDKASTDLVREAVTELYGEDKINEMTQSSMGGEDFSYFLEKVPGSFISIGAKKEDLGFDVPHHHPKFDIDETVLSKGSAILAETALLYLNQDF